MNRKIVRIVLALAAGAALASGSARPANAVVTARWIVDNYKDWDAGEGDSVLVTSEGEIKPGWKTDKTSLEVDATWAAVRVSDGSILLGTDEDAAIYKVKGNKVSKLTNIKGVVAVVSLAVDARGQVYAGTMPGGEVWRVDASSGKATKLVALPDAETVWSLAFDAKGKALYAGTGPDGKLFSIDPGSGKARVAFATDDKRIMSLAATSDGAIWLGTSDKALVFRYDPSKGTARAMADFDGNEVTALAALSGGVVAVANEFTEPTSTGARSAAAANKGTKKADEDEGQKAKKPKVGTEPGADKEEPTNAKLPRPGARKGKGALYRIEVDGRLEQLHALTATYFTSVAVDANGDVFAGAGDKGRIYLVDAEDAVSTAFDVSERQIGQIVADAKGLAFTTTDGASFYRASGAANKAIYMSKVQDTGASSHFGRIAWHGRGKVKVETRTGNTAKPGIGWSKWAAPAKVSRGGGEERGGRITSPPGRYLQFRVTFNGDRDSVVRSAAVYHLPRNRATKVTEITVDGGDDKLVTNKADAKPRSPVIKLKWKVENPDKDETLYTLAVRREGDVKWRKLRNKDGKPITKAEYEWNTETFPDGHYQLRVTASDIPANAGTRALRSSKITPLFLVDNAKPQLSGVTVRYPQVSARATDGMSAIAEASWSVDDGRWILADADDGLFDTLSEILTFRLPDNLEPGVHTLSIRVADEAGNIGSESVTFRVR